MNVIRGYYYDGRSSRRHDVLVSREGDMVRLKGEEVDLGYLWLDVRVMPRVGDNRRQLRLPDGGQCEIVNALDLRTLLGIEEQGVGQKLLGRMERNLFLSLVALAATILLIFLFIKFGIPAAARRVAHAVPPSTERVLGRETLAILDKMALKPTKLPDKRQQEVKALFRQMQGVMPEAGRYRLELRNGGPLGANALALPAGIIIVTDELVALAGSDAELAGVIAHEAGHERHRHALRHVLQNSGTGLLIAAVTGDITSITSLSAALPTALIDARYSREFENEADDAAVEYLVRTGASPRLYADMLARLQAAHDKKVKTAKPRGWSLLDLFATHPDTAERIRRVTGN